MSLKSTFLAFKKVVQVVQIGGWGGGNLDKIQKKSSFFFGTPSLSQTSAAATSTILTKVAS